MGRRMGWRTAVATLTLLSSAACSASPSENDTGTASASSEAVAAIDVSVSVDGRSLDGSCSGESADGRPTVVLASGLGNLGSQLATIEGALTGEVRVCSYDRAGVGSSDPAASTQSLTDVVGDLHAFLDQGEIAPPYVLAGHSLGGSIVIRYAQLYPDEVAGFISMNPVPPYTSWIQRASTVETPEELQTIEIGFYEGANDEGLDLRDTDLTIADPIADDIPYVVMYAENCPGDFCDRIRPPLEAATAEFAGLGAGGRFVSFPDAGHDIYRTQLDDIVAELRSMLE